MLWITCNLGLFVFFFCCSQADTNNHRKIMTKITKCSLRAPICGEIATADFFSIKILKRHSYCFAVRSQTHTHTCLHTRTHIYTHTCAHTIQIPRQAYRQTSGAEQKGKLRQRREEREKGWCLVFIIHTRVACSVTLFSCSSPLSLYPG